MVQCVEYALQAYNVQRLIPIPPLTCTFSLLLSFTFIVTQTLTQSNPTSQLSCGIAPIVANQIHVFQYNMTT